LKKLISLWAFRAGREANPTAFLESPRLPDDLLSRITSVEPFRSRAISDAEIYWTIPLPFGFGMELFFPEKIETEMFENWPETIRGFSAEMEYCERMEGRPVYRYDVRLERVGRARGEWRIIEVFGEAERGEMLKVLQITKDFHAQKNR
jgi:hypothetical protein